MSEIQVSVVCIAYNHERYIMQCLDSVLSQKTTFDFEVIVHDDASTDKTASIIEAYEKRYPNKVVGIIEKENCLQNGILFENVIKERIKGRYVALCECDDWWTDDSKLQRQWEYMETHADCALHVHAVQRYSEESKKIVGKLSPSWRENNYSTDDVILGDGGMFGTNSMFFRAESYPMPKEYCHWGVGDYPTAIYLSTLGFVHFVPRSMSVYRVGSIGSWTERMANSDFAAESRKKIVDSLREWDRFTNYRHHSSVEKRIALWVMEDVSLRGNWDEIANDETRSAYRSLDPITKLKYWLKVRCSNLFKLIRLFK